MWTYRVGLQGSTLKDKRTLRFILAANHATLDLAVADAAAIKTALVAATKAFVSFEKLEYLISTDNQVPVDVSADCFEEAAISCYLNEVAVAEKLYTVALPAPEDSVFLEDGSTLIPGNTLIQNYIDELENRVTVSDGEFLVSDGRTNGAVKGGYKRSKSRNFS